MKYDFTSVIDRAGHDALAVEGLGTAPGFSPMKPEEGFDIIPMWVADMNFPAPECITGAIRGRLDHPVFGYFMPRQEYFDAIIGWQQRRNRVTGLEEKHIGYENGVLGGVVSAANVLCAPGEEILVNSPTYVGFTNAMANAGFRLLGSPMVRDHNGTYRMDYADMEEKIISHNIHCAILCSPHNPCGRVWEKWELEEAMELYKKHNVFVISDEIWSDLTLPGFTHIPTQSVSEDAKQRTIAFYAPSKTFNLAGLVGSYHIIYNDYLRERVERQSRTSHYNEMNVLSMYGLIGGFSKDGEEWLEELRTVLEKNLSYGKTFLENEFPGIRCSKPEGTYMMFVDLTEWCAAKGKTLDEVLEAAWRVGVAIQDGRPFHGDCHTRMNFALPFSRVEEAMDRLKKYVLV